MTVHKNGWYVYITLDRDESDNINYNVIVGLLKYSEGENNKHYKLLCPTFRKKKMKNKTYLQFALDIIILNILYYL